ncbi:hypothetical protein FACS1894152_1800 [Bacilli bacterium]|nr:hypothetical protein FACS1894152_1800 [Bacilli bacterium]
MNTAISLGDGGIHNDFIDILVTHNNLFQIGSVKIFKKNFKKILSAFLIGCPNL